jgi:hypothetical protein
MRVRIHVLLVASTLAVAGCSSAAKTHLPQPADLERALIAGEAGLSLHERVYAAHCSTAPVQSYDCTVRVRTHNEYLLCVWLDTKGVRWGCAISNPPTPAGPTFTTPVLQKAPKLVEWRCDSVADTGAEVLPAGPVFISIRGAGVRSPTRELPWMIESRAKRIAARYGTTLRIVKGPSAGC